jgi:ubiquinone/menaquinone biosynthesis C-methylase UbiE
MTVAAVLMEEFSYEGAFDDFCRDDGEFRRQRILDFSQASPLQTLLKPLPHCRVPRVPHAGLHRLPEVDDSIDVVISSNAAVPEALLPEALLPEWHRVLRPGGLLVLWAAPGPVARASGGPQGSGGDCDLAPVVAADVWVGLMRAGFQTVGIHTLTDESSVVLTARKAGIPLPEFTGERLVPSFTPSRRIALEHLHRYAMAAELCAGKTVLDIASGEGYGASLLACTAASVLGVDIDESSVAHANRKHGRSNLRFLHGDGGAIPAGDASFDLVVSFETLEHLSRQEEFVKEIRRVLKPEGVLVISTPDRQEYSEKPGLTNPHHVRELDREELVALLAPHFDHVALAGQRCVLGSWIGEEPGTSARHGVFHVDYAQTRFSEGTEAPVFWLAACSNAPLPPLPTGMAMPEASLTAAWLEAFERLPSPHLALQYAQADHSLEPRGLLAGRVCELELTVRKLKEKEAELKEKLDAARVKIRHYKKRKEEEEEAAARRSRGGLRRRLSRWFNAGGG